MVSGRRDERGHAAMGRADRYHQFDAGCGRGNRTSPAPNTTLYTLAKTGLNTDFQRLRRAPTEPAAIICTAAAGYDYVTGLGTPQASALITALVAQHVIATGPCSARLLSCQTCRG